MILCDYLINVNVMCISFNKKTKCKHSKIHNATIQTLRVTKFHNPMILFLSDSFVLDHLFSALLGMDGKEEKLRRDWF